jgi:hypothetical protein
VNGAQLLRTAPADACASVKAYPTAFLHVDAAVSLGSSSAHWQHDSSGQWAGVAYALPDHRKALRLDDVNQFADSFCTNAHKWGLTGFDCCESHADLTAKRLTFQLFSGSRTEAT